MDVVVDYQVGILKVLSFRKAVRGNEDVDFAFDQLQHLRFADLAELLPPKVVIDVPLARDGIVVRLAQPGVNVEVAPVPLLVEFRVRREPLQNGLEWRLSGKLERLGGLNPLTRMPLT